MKKTFMGLIVASFVLLASHALAANYDNPVSGILKSVTGDTVTIEVPSVVSKSPDSMSSGDLNFKVDSNTGYKNFNQLADLKPGDPVQVEYSTDERSKRMLATTITKTNSSTTTTTTTNTTEANTTPGQGVPTNNVTPAPATVGTTTSTVPTSSTTTTTTNSST